MPIKRIAITGANGYIGSALSKYLSEQGHQVSKLLRHNTGQRHREFELGKPINSTVLDNIDILIHCAWDMSESDETANKKTNLSSSLALFHLAQDKGVRRLFISSISAYEQAKSVYGKSKFQVEMALNNDSDIIIRPGLVYSSQPGGIVGKLLRIKSPILPMIGSGHYKLYPCHLNDLCQAIHSLILSPEQRDNSLPPPKQQPWPSRTYSTH